MRRLEASPNPAGAQPPVRARARQPRAGPVGDIDYLLAEDKYVVVHHAQGEVLIEEPLTRSKTNSASASCASIAIAWSRSRSSSGLDRAPDGRVLARIAGATVPLEVSRRNLPALRKLVRSL